MSLETENLEAKTNEQTELQESIQNASGVNAS
jgi:hypothetical protein